MMVMDNLGLSALPLSLGRMGCYRLPVPVARLLVSSCVWSCISDLASERARGRPRRSIPILTFTSGHGCARSPAAAGGSTNGNPPRNASIPTKCMQAQEELQEGYSGVHACMLPGVRHGIGGMVRGDAVVLWSNRKLE